ncbi:MAG TPA: DUF4440 domain-containing protein [Acidobacteriaceae bacterium]
MRKVRLAVLLWCMGAGTGSGMAQAKQASLSEIAGLNQALREATEHMDNAATLALWAEDGVSLLPSTKPLVGKAAIAKFMDEVMGGLKGARMESFALDCFDTVVSGDLGSEWCTEHQVVELGGGKPVFDGRGKMLLVLRKGGDGQWRIVREMWNQAE